MIDAFEARDIGRQTAPKITDEDVFNWDNVEKEISEAVFNSASVGLRYVDYRISGDYPDNTLIKLGKFFRAHGYQYTIREDNYLLSNANINVQLRW